MRPSQILHKTRREHELTLEAMAEVLDTSRQRVHQWENGDDIPQERIDQLLKNESIPDWAKKMVMDMSLASIREILETSEKRLTDLENRIQATAV